MLDEEAQTGLWLNIERAWARKSKHIDVGIGAAFGGKDKNYLSNFYANEDDLSVVIHRLEMMKKKHNKR